MASVKGISLQDLYEFTFACFVKAGFSEEDAKVIAANLNVRRTAAACTRTVCLEFRCT